MYTFDQFKQSGKSLVILKDDQIVFESNLNALEPLIQFIKEKRHLEGGFVIYDKYIGRAAALLMTFLKPKKVYTPVISQFGREEFERFGIDYQFDKEVKYLMGVASEKMCRWEKMTVGKTPEEFWTMLTELDQQ